MTWRLYLDDFIQNIPSKTLYVVNSAMTIAAALTLLDWLNIGGKVVTFLISVGAGLLSLRHYMLKNKIKEKELEKLDQEIHAKVMENKQKFG